MADEQYPPNEDLNAATGLVKSENLGDLPDPAEARENLGLGDAFIFKGVIDCSGNPNYPAANRGDTYKVSVAGKIGGASGVTVAVGDTAYCITDGSASGTQAGVGANWAIVESNIVAPYFAGGTDVPITDGGTGSSTAAGARSNLSVPETSGMAKISVGSSTPSTPSVGDAWIDTN